MIEVESPSRLLTATYLPSGETAIWCGSFPTGILATSANFSFGAPSRTQTCSVFSLATNTRSFRYAGPAGAGDSVAATSVGVAIAVASATSVGTSVGIGVAGSSAASIEQAPITTARTASKVSQGALIPNHHHTSRARAEPRSSQPRGCRRAAFAARSPGGGPPRARARRGRAPRRRRPARSGAFPGRERAPLRRAIRRSPRRAPRPR